MGQSTLFGAAKLEKNFNSYNPPIFLHLGPLGYSLGDSSFRPAKAGLHSE
jgi:hypothetical protein